MADALWEELDKGGKSLSKQELLKRIREAKSKQEAARKHAIPLADHHKRKSKK